MPEETQQFQTADGQLQAVRFHSRERRRSLAGVPDMRRTHRVYGGVAMAVSTVDTGAIFPDRSRLVTFHTAVRITGSNPIGLIFEFGSSTRGIALGIYQRFLSFGAGGTSTEQALASYNNITNFPAGLEMDIVAAVRPGDGLVRTWVNGLELKRGAAAAGNLGGDWSDSEAGSFASASSGTVRGGFTALDQAPSDFEVIEPLSVYMGQVPRHFV